MGSCASAWNRIQNTRQRAVIVVVLLALAAALLAFGLTAGHGLHMLTSDSASSMLWHCNAIPCFLYLPIAAIAIAIAAVVEWLRRAALLVPCPVNLPRLDPPPRTSR